MKKLTLVILGLIVSQHLSAGQSAEKVTVKEYPANQVQQLAFELASGKAVLNGVKGDKVKVTAVHIKGDCKTEYSQKAGELSVSIKNERIGGGCEYNVTIELPTALTATDVELGSADFLLNNLKTSLTLKSGSGDQRLKKFSGKLEAKTGSGDFYAELDVESADIKTGSGEVKLDGSMHDFDIMTGSGDVDLNLEKLTQSGKGKIVVGSGDIAINAPKNADVTKESHFATSNVDISDRNGVSLHIDITKGSGNLKVR